uniref:Uncharacterized protein n=1 Tax=Strigamia maritima TaxID=126957 RepID=T1IPS1_STRMM
MADRKSFIDALVVQLVELENADLQKLEKELFSLQPFEDEEYFRCHEKIKNNLVGSISEKRLKRITLLLERRFRRFLQPMANFLMNLSLDTIQLWLKEDLSVSQNQVHLSIRIILQIIQYFWDDESMKDFNTSKAEELLFEIIKNNDCALESVMLAGTCLVRLIFAKCLHLENSVSNCVSFLISFVANNDATELTRLVFLTGLLNSSNNSVLLYKVEGIPLLLFILPLVLELCEKNINYIFQSFQLLLIWLGAMKKNLCHFQNNLINNDFQNDFSISTKFELVSNLLEWWEKDFESKFRQEDGSNGCFFQGSCRVFNSIFALLTVSWENFIRGVPDLVKDCFNMLLEVHLTEAQLKEIKVNLIEQLVEYYLKMAWTNRAKYPPLAILTEHYGAKNLLSIEPALPFHLTETLHSNPLSSSGADLYRVMLKKHREEEHDNNVIITLWKQTWLNPICAVINCNDSFLQQNLFRHWFPPTLAIVPEIYLVLMEKFSQNSVNEGFQMANITLMSQARQSGILNLENLDTNIIHRTLFHLNESIRMQAFIFLCSTKRKAEALSSTEVKLIEEFLVYNLNIDSAPFRQQLKTQMKSVLVRVRDSCGTWITEERKSQVKIPQLTESLKFIEHVFWLMIQNLNPGARYQRRQTCLDLLSILLDTFIAVPDVNKRKGGVPVRTPVLVGYAQKNDMWAFICDKVFHNLLCCLQDFMSEIKFLAIKILQKYFCDVDFLKVEENVNKLLNQGFKWLDSPKPHICESCDKYSKLIHELIDLVADIIKHVLSILASKSNSNCQAPSFEDMGLAIDNIIDAEGINMDENNPTLSVEHQLILSCCWLTLKECSFLMSKLVIKMSFSYPTKSAVLNPTLVRRMTDDLVNILFGCRHRGAIEACSIAMGELCQSLSSEQLPEYRDIPKSILNSALEVIRTPNYNSSITRRSAGLPLLFIAIISNESTSRKRFLLDTCIDDLIGIATTSLTFYELDVTDLPQTHAIHIIRALVHDSSLSQAVLPHMTNVIKLCIDSFASSTWSLRNAALQLFGSLVSRLLGQKKVRDESSQHNSITAEVLFYRYPDIKLYLIKYLQRLESNANPAEPGLVPILSLLSKLSTNSDGVNIDEDFSGLLDSFIASPFFVIRKLTANAFIATNNKSHKCILDMMIEKFNDPLFYQTGVNYIHGVALIILQLLESNEFSSDQLSSLESCLTNCYSIIITRFGCYFLHALILKIVNKISAKKLNVLASILQIKRNSTLFDVWKPGYSEWTKEITLIKLKTASKSDVLELTKTILCQKNQNEILCCLNYIKSEMTNDLTPAMNLVFQEQLINLLCSNPHAYHVQESLTVLQNLIGNNQSIVFHPQINSHSFLAFLKCAIKGTFGTLSAACTTVFVGFFLSTIIQKEEFLLNSDSTELLNVWCNQIYSHSDPRKAEDLRMKSAEALNLFGASLLERLSIANENHTANWLLSLFHTGIALLIDENLEIRQKAAEFASLLPRSSSFYNFAKVNHNYGLEIFCNYFASKLGKNIFALDALWAKMSNDSSTKIFEESIKEERQCMLFEQDDINIYAEHFQLTKIYSSILLSLLTDTKNSVSINMWVQEKINIVISDAENTALYLKTNLSDLPSINALCCYKSFGCIHSLLSQIQVMLNTPLITLENKCDLQKLQLTLRTFCIASWITD